jgi:hypothetical protein
MGSPRLSGREKCLETRRLSFSVVEENVSFLNAPKRFRPPKRVTAFCVCDDGHSKSSSGNYTQHHEPLHNDCRRYHTLHKRNGSLAFTKPASFGGKVSLCSWVRVTKPNKYSSRIHVFVFEAEQISSTKIHAMISTCSATTY